MNRIKNRRAESNDPVEMEGGVAFKVRNYVKRCAGCFFIALFLIFLTAGLSSCERKRAPILGLKSIPGLFGDFKMDRFGDPQRKRFLIAVKAGRFQTME